MGAQTIRDRLWLWGMKVNVLQESSGFGALQLGRSAMTVEDAIQRTGITNAVMAGALPLDEQTLAAMPSARRIICKHALHADALDYQGCLEKLMDAKRLAAQDPRVEAFLVDDFSTGSLDAGARPEHLARLQFENALHHPRLPLDGTIYTMSLERPELPPVLPYFDLLIVPLWHADHIDGVPASLSRLSGLSGGKPMIFCLYLYDFGNSRGIPRELMQRHLDLAESLLREKRVAGVLVCGTCLMDLDWEANHCFYDWLERVGDDELA